MKMLTLLYFTMAFSTSCESHTADAIQQPALPAETFLNLAYGKDSAQRMDLYLPANRSADTTKLLVLFHGGGWAGGDKAEFAPVFPLLQLRLPQYAIANVNYRLATQVSNHFPTQETDVQAALQWLVKNAATYHISKQVVLLGVSAGAHLALLQAYKYTTPLTPLAVISFFGPGDLAALYNGQSNVYYKMGLQLLLGGTPVSKPDVYAEASPATFAGQRYIPTLLFHGGRDNVVPLSQSQTLKQKLEAAGVPVKLIVYPAEGHGWFGATLADSYQQIETFLNTHLSASGKPV